MSKKSKTQESIRAPRLTMLDVAKRAGVSTAAVSLALRHHHSISPATRERIFEAQRELGYTLNRFARQFVRDTRGSSQKRQLEQLAVCLLNISFSDAAYTPFFNGIMQESQARNMHLYMQSLVVNAQNKPKLPAALREGSADGIILTGFVTDATVAFFQRLGLPLVVLGNYSLHTAVVRVEFDLRLAGLLMVEKVVERKHQRIAFAVEELVRAYELDGLEAIKIGLTRHGLELPSSHILCSGRQFSIGAAFIEPFLRLDPLPTAIITTDPRVADECVAELRARQIGVPGPVEIFSLASDTRAPWIKRYSALDLNMERCGRTAVERLAELAENPNTEPSTTAVPASGWVDPDLSILAQGQLNAPPVSPTVACKQANPRSNPV